MNLACRPAQLRGMPSLACLNSPLRTMPRLSTTATPMPAPPSQFVPAMPCQSGTNRCKPSPSRPAESCQAFRAMTNLSCRSWPLHAMTHRATPAMPHRDMPGPDTPCLPFRALPVQFPPNLACHAKTHRTGRCHAKPSPVAPAVRKLALTHQARPSPAAACRATPAKSLPLPQRLENDTPVIQPLSQLLDYLITLAALGIPLGRFAYQLLSHFVTRHRLLDRHIRPTRLLG